MTPSGGLDPDLEFRGLVTSAATHKHSNRLQVRCI